MRIETLLQTGIPKAQVATAQVPEGFAATLDALLGEIQTGGAPPGPPGVAPPIQTVGSEELKTQEPNAQSIEPDLTALSQQGALTGQVFLNALSFAIGPTAAAVGTPPATQSLNGQVQAFVEGQQVAPVNPEGSSMPADGDAFNKLMAAPELGIKMIRVDKPTEATSKPAPEMLVRRDGQAMPLQTPEQDVSGPQAAPQTQSPAQNLIQPSPNPLTDLKVAAKEPQVITAAAQVAAAHTDATPARDLLSKAGRTESKGLQVEGVGAKSTVDVTAAAMAPALQGEADGEPTPDSDQDFDQDEPTQEAAPMKVSESKAPTLQAPAHSKAEAAEVKTPAPLDATQRERLIGQVSDRIEALAARRLDSVTIHLNPLDMGDIKLVLHQLDGRVEAQVYTQDERVRHALQMAQPGLSHSLEQRGIRLEHFQVATMSTSQDGSSARQQAAQSHQQSANPRFITKPEPVRAATLVGATRGVDLTV